MKYDDDIADKVDHDEYCDNFLSHASGFNDVVSTLGGGRS